MDFRHRSGTVQPKFAGKCTQRDARSTVHTLAQMGPPMLNVAASLGSFTCSSAGALPSN